MLADGVEAATRSLRRVTPQHLGELIDQIFSSRLEDGQLEEAPVTLAELTQIKSSFAFTLLNMLHARVAYSPAAEKAETPPMPPKNRSKAQVNETGPRFPVSAIRSPVSGSALPFPQGGADSQRAPELRLDRRAVAAVIHQLDAHATAS